MIRRNYAKTFEGGKTRILDEITALIVIQYINKTYCNRNINNLKNSNYLKCTTGKVIFFKY